MVTLLPNDLWHMLLLLIFVNSNISCMKMQAVLSRLCGRCYLSGQTANRSYVTSHDVY